MIAPSATCATWRGRSEQTDLRVMPAAQKNVANEIYAPVLLTFEAMLQEGGSSDPTSSGATQARWELFKGHSAKVNQLCS